MINKCPCCNNMPVDAGMISCQTVKCLNYDDKYFVWEWQALGKELIELAKLEAESLLDV